MAQQIGPVARLWHLVKDQKADISEIYFLAILGGLIQLSLPLGIQSVIGFVLTGTLSTSITILIIVVVAGVLFTGIIQVSQMGVIEKIQQRIFVHNSFTFADRIPRLDLKKVDGFYLPELVNRFFETNSLQKGLSKLLLELPTATIQVLFGLVLLSLYHPFFILFGVLLIFSLWLILRVTGHRGLASSLDESRHKYALVGWLEEMARLAKSFKFSAGGLHLKKADEKTTEYLQARTTHFRILEFQYCILIGFKLLITAAMLVGGVLLLLNQQLNIGQFVAAEIIILMIISSVEKIIINLDSVYDVLTAVEKIGKLTDKPVETSGTYESTSTEPISLAAQNLSFGYEDHNVVRGLQFNIQKGEKVCVVGAPGSGKSTLLKLLTGVYKDFNGELLINDVPLGNYDLAPLRKNMGILFQNENVFQGTLWDNLTMGREGISREYILELCDIIGLRPFFESLPQGYDTELDPTGKRLSRSTVQKILLVRALAHKPALLIMEEPWQGVESDRVKKIQDLLINAEHSTVIVSTNDESFILRCQQTIRLSKPNLK